MKDLKWFMNRLKAMNGKEIAWRVKQKQLAGTERKCYGNAAQKVTEVLLPKEISTLHPDVDRIQINWQNKQFTPFTDLDLFGKFTYDTYKKQWNAGFQTENKWNETECSYDINCSQRVDIGDIRTNWELNRHYQFSLLAKSFYVTGEEHYLRELEDLFTDWNERNPFLRGVEWTSPMEIGIRLLSWIFTYCFLWKGFQTHKTASMPELLEAVSHGILAMAQYMTRHYSRFSSANNHLIVEAFATGMAGIFYQYEPWIAGSKKILDEELVRQNYTDGVNKEMSLHYQGFIMEAYGILILSMQRNHMEVPATWFTYLEPMSCFVADCCGDYGETIVFGDNDEGKLLDLCGKDFPYYQYVLDLMGCVLKTRFTDFCGVHENINWLVSDAVLAECRKKPAYGKRDAVCYKEGGYSILRSSDHKILIGIDHADLGFGSIAAHGHADALSFQMFVEGTAVFADPGTYNYHITPEDRDRFRSTAYHNTVTVAGRNQSEILGPFLWGKRAAVSLLEFSSTDKQVTVRAKASYQGIEHIRSFLFDYDGNLRIEDSICGEFENCELAQSFLLGPDVVTEDVNEHNVKCQIKQHKLLLECDNRQQISQSTYEYSARYNSRTIAAKLSCSVCGSRKEQMSAWIQIKK